MLFWKELARVGNRGQGIENQDILKRRGRGGRKGRELLPQGDLIGGPTGTAARACWSAPWRATKERLVHSGLSPDEEYLVLNRHFHSDGLLAKTPVARQL